MQSGLIRSLHPLMAALAEANWRKFELSKENKWADEALKVCHKAQRINPNMASVHITMGMIYSGTGKDQQAVKEFQNALENDANNPEAYRGLAKAYESLSLLDDAEATYQRSIELKPNYWAGYNDLGVFYYPATAVTKMRLSNSKKLLS